nr:transporter substrate-binding domain-containing protein [uncultured Cetobacterium sp.]
MGKILLYLLLSAILFGKNSRVLLENEDSFFYYKEGGENKGLYPEIFRDINRLEGLDLEVSELDTNLILQKQSKENILIMDLVENEERKKYYYFIPTFFYLKANLNYLGKPNVDITEFYGKRIGLIKGTYLDGEFVEKYSFLNFIPVDIGTRENGVALLKEGKIDAFVSDNQYGFSEFLNHITLGKIDQMVTTLAVPKTEKELYKKLKRYFENIPDSKLKDMIFNSRVEYYKDKFKDKYKELDGKTIEVLKPAEKSYYPLYYTEDNVEKGIAQEYMTSIQSILNVNFEYEHFNKNMNLQDYDIVMSSIVTEDREKDVAHTNPYYSFYPALFNRKQEGFVGNIIEIKDKKIGVVNSYYYLEYLKKYIPEKNLVYVSSLDEALRKVAQGTIDYGIGDYKTITNKIYNGEYEEALKVAGILDKKYQVSIGVNPNEKVLYEALKDISASFLNENMSKGIYWSRNNYENKDYKRLVFVSLMMLIISAYFLYKSKKNVREKEKYQDLMMSLVGALETANLYNDMETGNHIKRLNLYSELLASKLGCAKNFCQEIGTVASLHDVGKIGIDHSILKKPGKLTDEEFEIMKTHSEIGYDIIKRSGISDMGAKIARYHHERWDGKGYPIGISGERIPLEARIVAVVDVYDALRQKRVYKDGMNHEEAMKIIKAGKGTQFDPEIVDIFVLNEFMFERIFTVNM